MNTKHLFDAAQLEHSKNNLQNAKGLYRQIIKQDKNHADALHFLGMAYLEEKDFESAKKYVKRSLELSPNDAVFVCNYGMVLEALSEIAGAIDSYKKAISLKRDYAQAHLNLGLTQKALGEFEPAIKNLKIAQSLAPKTAKTEGSLALALLSELDFSDGWEHYRWRDGANTHDLEKAHGDLRDKSILMLPEQGIGDEIFFLRFANELKKLVKKLYYKPTPKIESLLRESDLEIEILSQNETPNAELKIKVGDMPLLLGMDSLEKIPDSIKLNIEKSKKNNTIGITWRAGTTNRDKLSKEVPLDGLIELLKDSDKNVAVLQRQPLDSELKRLKKAFGARLIDHSALNDNLPEMARLLGSLDEHICVSNTNIHIAEAMGIHTRVLVQNPAEWRWLNKGDLSPWFKHASIYRQETNNSWNGALAKLKADLAL